MIIEHLSLHNASPHLTTTKPCSTIRYIYTYGTTAQFCIKFYYETRTKVISNPI